MKKTISLLLSFVMLFSSVIGTSISANADDVDYTTISTNGTWYTGNITDYNTVDYYRVNLSSDGTLTFKFMQYMNRVYFEVYNSDLSNRIIHSYPGGGNASSPVTNTYTADLSKGTYYVKITKDGGNTGKYKLNSTFKSFSNNEKEPNDYENAMLLSAGNKVTGALTVQDDVDWYRIRVGAKCQSTFKFTQYMGYTIFEVYNSDLSNCIIWQNKGGGNASSPVTNTYTADLSKGTYYVKITKDGGNTGKYKLSWNLNVKVSRPNDFRVSNRNTTSLKLDWNKVSGVSGYQIQRKVGSKYKHLAYTSKNYYAVKDLKSATNYALRVRAYKTIDGRKYYSSWRNLTTPTKPSKVSIKTPSTNSKHQIIVKWKALSRGSGYQVQFSKKKSFSSVIATKTVSGKTKTSYTGKKFTNGRTYYVRVRGYKSVDGTKYYGAWSNVKSIKCK